MSSVELIIPDLLVNWPWTRVLDPNLQEVTIEANEWVESLDLFDPSQFKKFKGCDFNRLGALSGYSQGKDQLRITCDLMNVLFAFDEYTDLADAEEAIELAQGVMNAFHHTEIPFDNKLTEMVRQFCNRTMDVVRKDKHGFERFIADFDNYTRSVIEEADDRAKGLVRTVEDYVVLRRNTSAVKPYFSFNGIGLRIPHEVFQHPLVISMIEGATDLIALANDMHSYGVEYSRGLHGHNVITAIMKEYRVDLQGAFLWLSGYATKTVSKFFTDRRNLPLWGPDVDAAVHEYFERVGRCVRGCEAWSYETNRYYGKNGLKVQETRRLALQPHDGGYSTKDRLQRSDVLAQKAEARFTIN